MQGVANRTPILRNAAFASVPSRNPQARSLAQSTFRGGSAYRGFVGERSGGHHRSFGSVLGFACSLPPYAYNDFVDYTFSPDAYDTFWPMRMTISTRGSTGIMLLNITRMKTPMRTRARRHQVRLMRMQLEHHDNIM